MDLISHAVAGIAVSTIVAGYNSNSSYRNRRILLTGALGGIFPDLDTISLWRFFDTYIGNHLHLSHTGKEIYFEKFWYSHHGFMHSLLAALIITYLLFRLIRFVKWKEESKGNGLSYAIAFGFGYITHLLFDLPTPGLTWGGINLFFPFNEYTGGAGLIWWWNNYDIFLVLFTIALINSILIYIKRYTKKAIINYFLLFVLVSGSIVIQKQIYSRDTDFNNCGTHCECEQKSKEIQEQTLGKSVYKVMDEIDRHLFLNF